MKSVNIKKEALTVSMAIGLVAGGVLGASAQQQRDRGAERPGISQQEQSGQEQRQRPGQRQGAQSDWQQSGQQSAQQYGQQQGIPLSQAQPLARASELLDKEVHGQDGKLGDVEDIILSQDRKSVEHIEVSLDDGENIKLSLDDFSVKHDDEDALQVKGSKQELQQRSSKDRDQSRIGSRSQDDQARSSRQQEDQASHRVSKLIGMDIKGSDGNDVGSINDLIIDTDSGQIKRVAIETGGFLGLGANLASVEWQQVNFAADGDSASIRMSKDQLSDNAHSKSDYWERHAFEGLEGQRGERGMQQRRGQDGQSEAGQFQQGHDDDQQRRPSTLRPSQAPAETQAEN